MRLCKVPRAIPACCEPLSRMWRRRFRKHASNSRDLEDTTGVSVRILMIQSILQAGIVATARTQPSSDEHRVLGVRSHSRKSEEGVILQY